ncbi:MAG: hypothetical protein AAGC81_09660 [Pseudomonadota bacterium]
MDLVGEDFRVIDGLECMVFYRIGRTVYDELQVTEAWDRRFILAMYLGSISTEASGLIEIGGKMTCGEGEKRNLGLVTATNEPCGDKSSEQRKTRYTSPITSLLRRRQ